MTSTGGTDSIVERSNSPPGRESRQDWKGAEKDDADHVRSRSRSPHGNGKAKQYVYDREGSNTIRDEPHYQRARLFVGNIDHKRIRKTDLVKRFSQYGDVLGASVHKGYAFVQMDREKNANKAINYEHNQLFNGTRINVEFSQAALKAGAKFERLPMRKSPVRDLRDKSEAYAMLEIEREREDRLSRILEMERELNYLRQSREELYDTGYRRGYDREGYYTDSYRRASPPPRDYLYPRDEHPLDRLYADRSYGEASEDRRAYYDHPSSPPPPRSGPPNSYRTSPGPVAYPLRGSATELDSRGPLVGAATRPLMGSDARRDLAGNRFGGLSQLPATGVGYGTSSVPSKASSGSGSVASLPPGWPASEYEKSRGDVANRPPFAGAWS